MYDKHNQTKQNHMSPYMKIIGFRYHKWASLIER